MTWRPGPAISGGACFPDYDETDPWTQRFISKADDGKLSLDVQAMNGLETAAGAIFVDLIRQQAERPPSPSESTLPSWMAGRPVGRNQHHPPSMKAEPPMAQYQPFRRTYVSDPACVPQLRYANVSDMGAEHDKRAAQHHWCRAGSTWSRVPRFRKGESAFNHDPCYKPPHAVVDKWYATEVGSKTSLMGRVQESRWQTCHSMQSGRDARQPTRSRLPRAPVGAGPGPASYKLEDPWEVKQVCGTVPKSRMFCEPVRRTRPRTTACVLDFSAPDRCGMSVDVCTGPMPHPAEVVESRNRRSNGWRDGYLYGIDNAPSCVARRPITTVMPSPIKDFSGRGTVSSTSVHRKHTGARGSGCGNGNGDRGPQSPSRRITTAGRSRSGTTPSAAAPATTAGPRARPPTVGPLSFARAERPYISDEGERREESYGKKVMRLLTGEGDVILTVNRRRASAWGDHAYCGLRPDGVGSAGSAGDSAAVGFTRTTRVPAYATNVAAPRGDMTSVRGGDCNGEESAVERGGVARAAAVAVAPGLSCAYTDRTINQCGRGVPIAHRDRISNSSSDKERNHTRRDGVRSRARRLLPAESYAASLPVYREPGRAELPVIFRGTSAPILRIHVDSKSCGSARSGNSRRSTSPPKAGLMTSPDDGLTKNRPSTSSSGESDEPLDADMYGDKRESNGALDRVELLVSSAEALVSGAGHTTYSNSGLQAATVIPSLTSSIDIPDGRGAIRRGGEPQAGNDGHEMTPSTLADREK